MNRDLMLDIATSSSDADASSPFGDPDCPSPNASSSPANPQQQRIHQHLDVIASKSASFKWLHDHAWRRGRKTHTVLAVSHMAFVLITGILNIVASFAIPPVAAPNPTSKEDPPQAVDISSAVFLFMSLVIAGAQHLLRWEQTAESHRMSALRFSALYRNILRHNSHGNSNDVPSIPFHLDHYFTWVTGEYDTLCNQAPRIPDAVLRHFHTTFHHPPPKDKDELQDPENPTTHISPLSTYALDTAAFRYELDRFMLNEYQLH